MSTVEQFAKETAEAAANEPIPFDPTATHGARENSGKPEGSGDNKDYSAVATLIEKIEAEQARIDQYSEEYKRKAAPHRDAMKSLKKQIRDEHGIEAKALSAIIAKRRSERRMKERIAKLEEPAKGQFDQLELAL